MRLSAADSAADSAAAAAAAVCSQTIWGAPTSLFAASTGGAPRISKNRTSKSLRGT